MTDHGPRQEREPVLDPRLDEVLVSSQALGFIGPGDLRPHVAHALGFAEAVGDGAPARVLDLGSGGGVPGLVLALLWPASCWVLLDSNERRTAFLATAVSELECGDRVQVVRERAELAARGTQFRGTFDAVVARSFGLPAVVAECAAGFLRVGGVLVVSEPPEGPGERWPGDGLRQLGLSPIASPAGYQRLRSMEPCPPRYPRRVGIPTKRPLF